MTITNMQFAMNDEEFRLACGLANVKPTRRQASKFRREEGLAFKALRFARNNGYSLNGDTTVRDLISRLEFARLRLKD